MHEKKDLYLQMQEVKFSSVKLYQLGDKFF